MITSQILRELQTELKEEYQLGAFAWADKHMDGAHDKAITRFSQALEGRDFVRDKDYLTQEAEIYKQSMLKILRGYKNNLEMNDRDAFLSAIGKKHA